MMQMDTKQTIWTVLYCFALIGLAISLIVGTVTKYITPGESLIGALVLCVGGLLNRKMEKVKKGEEDV